VKYVNHQGGKSNQGKDGSRSQASRAKEEDASNSAGPGGEPNA
jgi:hypothetical protein